jgi:hypothetical protein
MGKPTTEIIRRTENKRRGLVGRLTRQPQGLLSYYWEGINSCLAAGEVAPPAGERPKRSRSKHHHCLRGAARRAGKSSAACVSGSHSWLHGSPTRFLLLLQSWCNY